MNTCEFSKDCSKVPIPNRCVEYCLERILRNVTIEEKQLILGLSKELSLAIFNAYNNYFIGSFSDIRNRLTSQQTQTLLDKFKSINQFQLDYFKKSRDERDAIIEAIKRLGLDLDNDNLIATDY